MNPTPPPPVPADPARQAATAGDRQQAARPLGFLRRRIVRYLLLLVVAYLLLSAIAGAAVPYLLERYGLPRAAQLIGREITIREIRFNPFRLSLLARGLRIAERDGRDFVSVAEIDVDLSIRSVRHLGPVIDRLRLVAPDVRLQRGKEGRFNFGDILERFAAQPGSETLVRDPMRFVLSDVELSDGTIRFDDRMLSRSHRVEQLAIRVPWVSNLPDVADIEVTPALSARVDGSPLNVDGRATPFSPRREASFRLDLRDFAFGGLLGWSPVKPGFTIPSGALTTALQIDYASDGSASAPAHRLAMAGRSTIDGLRLDDVDGQRLLSVRRIAVGFDRIEPLASRFAIGEVSIDGLDAAVARASDGGITLVRALLPRTVPAAPGKATRTAAAAVDWRVRKTTVRDGRVLFTDRTVSPPVTLDHRGITADIAEIGSRQAAAAAARLSLKQNVASTMTWNGRLDFRRSRAVGRVSAEVATLAPFLPYLAGALNGRLETGRLAAEALMDLGWAEQVTLAVTDGKLGADAIRLRLPDDDVPVVVVGRIAAEGLRFGLAERRVTVAQTSLSGADVRLVRDAQGRFNLSALAGVRPPGPEPVAGSPPASSTTASSTTASSPTGSGPPVAATAPGAWTVLIDRLDLGDNAVSWQDLATPVPVSVPLTRIAGRIDGIGTDLSSAVRVDLRAVAGDGGEIAARGSVIAAPPSADLALQLARIALAPFDPYLAGRVNVSVDDGAVSSDGQLRYEGERLRFTGQIGVDGVRSHQRDGSGEILRWGTLALDAIDVDISAAAPGPADRITIGSIALADFFAKVELNEQGRVNLQDIVRKAADAADPPPAAESGSAAGGAMPEPVLAAGPVIRLGGIRLDRGSSNFTDRYVKPNITVDLTELSGSVSAMASDRPAPADVVLKGRIDGDAPVEIDGQLNPLGPTLYTDLRANAKGIDLPTFTPYSGKYAGYAIEKGKLSLDLQYRIENGKLEAKNRLFLDQLTFGEKVDSPDAIDLPLQFAISLLKNSRGEIDLSLPLTGSLTDPQFSIGDIVWKAVVNLLGRIVTAPFTALAAAFGGGEELSFVEFRPGTAELLGGSVKRLETMAKALSDRPSLKLEIAGRVDPKREADEIGRIRLDERLQALKAAQPEAAPGAAAAPAPASGARAPASRPAAIDKAEYPVLLKRLYDETALPDKPKGAPGKEVTVAEIERRLLAAQGADAEAIRRLATQRSQVARDWLASRGKIPGERMFLLAPRIGAGATGPNQDRPQCTASCVEFSLR